MKIRTVDQQDFVRFYTTTDGADAGRLSPIRLYRIEDSKDNIKVPTPLFRPTFNCLVIVSEGELKLHADSSEVVLKKYSVFNSRSGHISATLGFSSHVKGYFLAYEDEVLIHLFSAQEKSKLHLLENDLKIPPLAFTWVNEAIALMESEMKQQNSQDSVIASVFQAITRKLLSYSTSTQQQSDKRTQLSFAFRELAHANHHLQKSVGFYAKKLSVSENYLMRCVKQCTGKSPKTILIDLDIEYALLLLQQPGTDINGVASFLGYEDPSYFARIFKKNTGKTPRQHRKKKNA